MKFSAVGLVVMYGVLAGCSLAPTVATNGVNYGINISRSMSADRSVFNVLDDLSIKNTINNALFDEALLLSINTDVYQGRVMLTGSVKDAATRQKAVDLARGVDGVRELYNEIQVTDKNWLKAFPQDLLIENVLAAQMILAPDVSSVDYQVRVWDGVVYVLGIAKSRAELDQVIALTRASGARKIVSHVFLSEQIVLNGAPETTVGAKVKSEPSRVDTQGVMKKPVARSAPLQSIAP